VSPVGLAFYRVFFAWICLVPYCIIKNKLKIERKQLVTALLAGIVFASDIAVWNISLLKISATVSTLLANLAPVWVGLLSFLILRKRSGLMFWIGTFVAVAGMVVLVGYNHILHLEFNIGIVLALLASFFYATYIMITKNIMGGIDVFTFMFYSMLSSGITLLIISAFLGNDLVHFSLKVWLCFVGMGIICQLIGWLTINYSLRYLESTKVAIALLSQTVFTGLLAGGLLNEHLSVNEIMGSIIVLIGIGITFIKQRQLTV
jgi:drug/metabolite transporter (DMT)-like permease